MEKKGESSGIIVVADSLKLLLDSDPEAKAAIPLRVLGEMQQCCAQWWDLKESCS